MWKRWWWGVGGKDGRGLLRRPPEGDLIRWGNIPLRVAERRPGGQASRSTRVLAATVVWFIVESLLPLSSFPIGLLCYQTMEERTMGIRGLLSPSFIPGGRMGKDGWSFFLEGGEGWHFGIPGLKTDYSRVGVGGKHLGLAVHSAILSSPVGQERLFGLEAVSPWQGRAAVSVGLQYYTADITGCERSYLLAGSLRMRAELSSRTLAGYAIERVSILGETVPGVDAAIYVSFSPSQNSTIFFLARLPRGGPLVLAVSSRITVLESLRLALGYDDGTQIISTSLALLVRRVGVNIGASFHPVLGPSEGIFLSWWK